MKIVFDPYEDIEGGPVVGVPYQTPLLMPFKYQCRVCSRSFLPGDFYELEESGELVHQMAGGERSCGVKFDTQTGEALWRYEDS